MIDQMATRYKVLPHKVLRADFDDFLIDLAVAEEGAKHDKPQQVIWVKGK